MKKDRNPFDGGDGSAENPYLVSHIRHLLYMMDYPDKHFKQTEDIRVPPGIVLPHEREEFTGKFVKDRKKIIRPERPGSKRK